ncbi:MAG: CinA family nicotinamide mononucleotide deamidase-related protein [Myxococcota bacterium]
MLRFDVVSQGEELVSGATTDTNAAKICQALGAAGLVCGRVTVVGDERDAIRDVLAEAAARSKVVVCTGGLGPTTDDLTAEACGTAFGRALYEDADALRQIETRYAARKRPMPVSNRKQARMPEGAEVLENHLGTAPGFLVEHGGTLLFFLPGVPFEMEAMLAEHVVPRVRARFQLPPRRTVILRCFGVAESVAGEKMAGFERPGVVVGYRASMPEVQVKLHLDPHVDAAPLVAEALARLGDVVFGVDSGPLAAVVGESLLARQETVAVAESCTGGRVAAAITAVPGASGWFHGGALVYSNDEKVRQCGVRRETLVEHGAVSEPVARQLAEGVRAHVGTTWGIGVTGIAGPTGGTPEKPVGTVHLAVAGPGGTIHRRLRFPYDRDRVLTFSAAAALDLLRRAVEGLDT